MMNTRIKLFLLFLNFSLGLGVQAQERTISQQASSQEQTSVQIDQLPLYPGGIPAFRSAI